MLRGTSRTMMVAGIVLLTACASDRRPVGEVLIGPSGGTVELDDSSAMLQLPAGALDKETKISITKPAGTTLPTGAVPGTLVQIGPAGITFQKPAKLTILYDAKNLPSSDTAWLRAIQVLEGGKLGATLLVSQDTAAASLTAKIAQTGTYVLADLKLAGATVSTQQQQIKDVDVLFVVDNSNSMAEEQQNLAQNFPKLMQKLDQAGLDYHVGVVSSDLGAGAYGLPSCETAGGDGGKLWNKVMVAGCTPPSDPWISKVGGAANVPGGDVASAFSCIAQIGTGGCGFENTLESARRALDPKLNVNPGFVRQNAALAVVLITDEDDCSAQKPELYDPSQSMPTNPLGPLTSFRCFEFGVKCDINDRTQIGPRQSCQPDYDWLHKVDDYSKYFLGLKPAGRMVLAAIAGPDQPVAVGVDGPNPTLQPSCQSAQGKAAPAIRIKALTDAMGSAGYFNTGKDGSGASTPVNICSSDFSPALSFLGDLLTTKILTSWCLPYDPADVDPLTAGSQSDCVVMGSKAGQIPACTATSTTACFSVVSSQSCAASSSVLTIENAKPADLGDQVLAICLVL